MMSGAILRALLGAVALPLACTVARASPLSDDGQGNAIAALTQSASFSSTHGFLDRLHERTTAVDPARPSGDGRGFLSGYGDRIRWDETARSRRWGLSAGFMSVVDDGISVGFTLAAGAARHSIITSHSVNRALADDYVAAIHARVGAASQPLYLTLAAGHGWTLNDVSRETASLGTVAARDVTARQWFGSVELGRDWQPVDGFVLTGFARTDAARLQQDGYAELPLDGATMLPASVKAAEATALRSLLGARAALNMATARRSAILSVHAAWSHEFETDRSVGFSRVIADPLDGVLSTVTGVARATRIDENSIRAGASVEAPVNDSARIYVGYNALFASGHDSQSAEAGLRVTW
jgi:outer membrane autotransporter protein